MEAVELSILGPAFVAGLLVLLTHVPLGHEVLKRGIIFIDLAIAQIAAFGVILAARLGFDTDGLEVQFIAIGSALLGAWLLSLIEKRQQKNQEAIIGVSFILAATGSIILLSDNPHGGEQLKDLLVGQILWITWAQLVPLLIVTALILYIWSQFRYMFNNASIFYLLFAITVTNSVQIVGVYLVFASLIIPALGSQNYTNNFKIGWIIGASGYALGLIISSFLDLPSGAVIVWAIALAAILAYYFTTMLQNK